MMMLKLFCLAFGLTCFLWSSQVAGHGMMLEPPNRSSLWRFDPRAEKNYNDNENNCGGFATHWGKNDGLCGVCGDNYVLPHPQPNENTGLYGNGKIVAEYEAGEVVNISIRLTSNHLGHYEYHLCELENSTTYETEDCFKPLEFANGKMEYRINKLTKDVVNKVKLPEGMTCEHCVLRWHYKAANNWGTCRDGKDFREGCGPQVTFRSCSDIKIV